MLTAILVVSGVTLLLVGVGLNLLESVSNRVECQADAIRDLGKWLETPAGGLRLGRQWPTHQELEAARNRIDQAGVAHPGKPN